MIKFRMYYDKDAETQWLNEMCAQGWAMTNFFAGFYSFDKCQPGEYIYQVDIQDTFGKAPNDYRELMKEVDVEIIQNWGYWILLRKKAADGEFELYTDNESLIEHYSKIRKMFKGFMVIELIAFLIEVFGAAIGGINIGWLFAVIILALILVFVNAIVKTTDKINALKEEQTGISVPEGRTVSPLIMAGLLINSCMLVAKENLSDYIALPLMIFACVLMLVGIWRSAHQKKA